MNTLARKLIAKDFYLYRWLIVGSTVSGLLALLIAAEGEVRFNIGMLTWLTTIVAFGVVLAMMAIGNERKERTLQFVLSLPLSHGDYVRIKVVGLLLCFLVPWAVLGAGAVTLIAVMPNLPDGLLPFAVLMCGFFLANYSLVLCGALHTASEGLITLLIIVTNMNVTLFIFMVGALPSLHDHLREPAPEWNSTFWIVLGAELATFVITVSLPYFVAARRRDFN
ncbi:MAG TPA: ABC-2 transporter permease [Steroidobacteraceae bacterium]|jgi:ABC-type transport system involved in multi-copper enzyme maturation permease subunit|nr:ABC-2 transporter permease [Steroidobacteraceae bacterium]